jgi:NADH:ubiquinone oxidoreductase subunit 6 (subunit J)
VPIFVHFILLLSTVSAWWPTEYVTRKEHYRHSNNSPEILSRQIFEKYATIVNVGFKVLTAVVIKDSVIWDIERHVIR